MWHGRAPSAWAHWGGTPASPMKVSYAPFRGQGGPAPWLEGVLVDAPGSLQKGATLVEDGPGGWLLVYCAHESGTYGVASTVAVQTIRDAFARNESCGSRESDAEGPSEISEQPHLAHIQSRVKEERPMSHLESGYFRAALILILLAIALSIFFNAACGLSWWICCGERSKGAAPLRGRLAFGARMTVFGLALITFSWGFVMCMTDMWDDFHRFRCYAAVVVILGLVARVSMFEQSLKCNGSATGDEPRRGRGIRRDEYI